MSGNIAVRHAREHKVQCLGDNLGVTTDLGKAVLSEDELSITFLTTVPLALDAILYRPETKLDNIGRKASRADFRPFYLLDFICCLKGVL